jgi:hypothetical protein
MNPWMLFAISSMGVALAALRFTLFADKSGWSSMNHLALFLVVWLPLVSVVTLALLCGVALRTGLRWSAVAGISLLLGAVQFVLIAQTNSDRLANSFLPFVLLTLSGVALAL